MAQTPHRIDVHHHTLPDASASALERAGYARVAGVERPERSVERAPMHCGCRRGLPMESLAERGLDEQDDCYRRGDDPVASTRARTNSRATSFDGTRSKRRVSPSV